MRSVVLGLAAGMVFLGQAGTTPTAVEACDYASYSPRYSMISDGCCDMRVVSDFCCFYPPVACYPPPRVSYSYAPAGRPYQASYSPVPRAMVQPARRVEVGVYDNYFRPSTLDVSPGTRVRWTNRGRERHTVTSATGLWDSGDLGPGEYYSITFTRTGTYNYYCRIHPREMRGRLVVR
jgi:plastocyanin